MPDFQSFMRCGGRFPMHLSAAAVSGAASDASFLTERDDPAASAVRPGKFIWTHRISQPGTHSLRFCVNGCSNEIAFKEPPV